MAHINNEHEMCWPLVIPVWAGPAARGQFNRDLRHTSRGELYTLGELHVLSELYTQQSDECYAQRLHRKAVRVRLLMQQGRDYCAFVEL